MLGRVTLRLRALPGATRLEVEDDGWGLSGPAAYGSRGGEGLSLVRGLIVGALRHALHAAGHRASTTVAADALSGFRPHTGEALYSPLRRDLDVDEHCQRLSILAPADVADDEALPVVVWIHGGSYIFGAGVYIFIGTLFELFGFQAITTNGHTIALPAPLSDVNAAISLGCLSYGVILVGGIVANGAKGAGKALKDFSLPISMSFRMFGALLSGLLVTELVYYYVSLSFVVPVVVGVLFTLLHALIQAYVLTTLTSMFYGETTEKHAPKPKKSKKIKAETVNN